MQHATCVVVVVAGQQVPLAPRRIIASVCTTRQSVTTHTTTTTTPVLLPQLHFKRFLACARNKLWWMTPEWGSSLRALPPETQFLLLELDEQQQQQQQQGSVDVPPPLLPNGMASAAGKNDHPARYAVVLPLIDGDFRGTLRPSRCVHSSLPVVIAGCMYAVVARLLITWYHANCVCMHRVATSPQLLKVYMFVRVDCMHLCVCDRLPAASVADLPVCLSV